MRRRHGGERRRGVTLVEAMVLMTAVTAMLGLCTLLLGLALRLQSQGIAAFQRAETLDRLSSRFRTDVHAARSAVMEGGALRLGSDGGGFVEYREGERGGLSRVVVASGKDVGREVYGLSGDFNARPALREVEGRRFAVLSVDLRTRRDRIDPDRTMNIEAAVGRNVPRTPGTEGGRP